MCQTVFVATNGLLVWSYILGTTRIITKQMLQFIGNKHENSDFCYFGMNKTKNWEVLNKVSEMALLWHKSWLHLVLKFRAWVKLFVCQVVSDCKYFPGWSQRCNVCASSGWRREWPGRGGSRHVTTSGSPSSVPPVSGLMSW